MKRLEGSGAASVRSVAANGWDSSAAIRLALAGAAAAVVLAHGGEVSPLLWAAGGYAAVVSVVAALHYFRFELWDLRYALVAGDALLLGGLLFSIETVARPSWAIAAFALGAAAATGLGPLRLSAFLIPAAVFAGVIAGTWVAEEAAYASAPIAVFGIVLFVSLRRIADAADAIAAWRSAGSAMQRLTTATTTQDVTRVIVEELRALSRADGVRLWRREPGNAGFVSMATAGDASLVPDDIVPPPAQESLAAGDEALVRELFASVPAYALRLTVVGASNAEGIAVLRWRTPGEQQRATDDEPLRSFAGVAAAALAEASRHDATLAMSNRDRVLQRAAEQYGFSDDPLNAQRTTVDAVREALGLAAAVLSEDGRVLHGDERAVTWSGNARFEAGGGMALAVERPPLDEAERAWLTALVRLMRAAVEHSDRVRRLQVELEVLRAMVEAVPVPLVLHSSDGTVLARSEAFRALNLALSAVAQERIELTAGTPPRDFLILHAPLSGGRRVVALKDVTEERGALRTKDELVRTMGHELRTPLTSVRGYTQMMGRHLDTVREQVARLDALIEDFMHTTEASEGLPLHMEEVDIGRLIEEVATRFRGSWEGRELRVDVEGTPPITGDAGRLAQVLDNLLSNAAKFSPADGPIELGVRHSDGSVVISVRDHGKGIAAEHLGEIFKREYRVPGASEEGHGLGLAIVQELVAAHGGRVWAESDGLDAGSTFWVSLPVRAMAGEIAGGQA